MLQSPRLPPRKKSRARSVEPAPAPEAARTREPRPKRARRPRRSKEAPFARRLGILSRNPKLYSTRRLVEAARALGHQAEVIDTLKCTLVLEPSRPCILYQDRELTGLDVVIPRIGASITTYGLAVVNQLDMMGVPVLNNSVPIARSRDKLRALQLLARFGVEIPRTAMARTPKDVPTAIERIGGLPAIVKLLQGTQGVGVMIAQSMHEVESILDTMWDLGQDILLQEFIAESKGRDIRALVVGDRIVGAMRRTAKAGEFRSNIHRGAEGQPVDLDPAYAAAAIKATRIIGLEVAGVDMLEAEDGPKIMEVNSSPGFEGLEKATGIDAATAIIEHAIQFALAHVQGWSKQRII